MSLNMYIKLINLVRGSKLVRNTFKSQYDQQIMLMQMKNNNQLNHKQLKESILNNSFDQIKMNVINDMIIDTHNFIQEYENNNGNNKQIIDHIKAHNFTYLMNLKEASYRKSAVYNPQQRTLNDIDTKFNDILCSAKIEEIVDLQINIYRINEDKKYFENKKNIIRFMENYIPRYTDLVNMKSNEMQNEIKNELNKKRIIGRNYIEICYGYRKKQDKKYAEMISEMSNKIFPELKIIKDEVMQTKQSIKRTPSFSFNIKQAIDKANFKGTIDQANQEFNRQQSQGVFNTHRRKNIVKRSNTK